MLLRPTTASVNKCLASTTHQRQRPSPGQPCSAKVLQPCSAQHMLNTASRVSPKPCGRVEASAAWVMDQFLCRACGAPDPAGGALSPMHGITLACPPSFGRRSSTARLSKAAPSRGLLAVRPSGRPAGPRPSTRPAPLVHRPAHLHAACEGGLAPRGSRRKPTRATRAMTHAWRLLLLVLVAAAVAQVRRSARPAAAAGWGCRRGRRRFLSSPLPACPCPQPRAASGCEHRSSLHGRQPARRKPAVCGS